MLSYKTTIKIKAKEIFKAECQGKRFSDIEYSDEIIGKIYGLGSHLVFNDICDLVEHHHNKLAQKLGA